MEAESIIQDPMDGIEKRILEPKACKAIEPRLEDKLWVHRYTDTQNAWTLSIATHAEVGSEKFSLGGFRIAPAERVNRSGYNNDREAIDLAIGMQEKVFWSRLVQAGGPRGLKVLDRIVGGKCVLLPGDDARVGNLRDKQLLDFAARCLNDFVENTKIHVITGQDLGHGVMSDGEHTSLNYLHSGYLGSVTGDTSKPTGEGNFYLLMGVLKGLNIRPEEARIGLIGCGNIGQHVLSRLQKAGVKNIQVLEPSELKRRQLEQQAIKTWTPDNKADFLRQSFDALVINANGGTLDTNTVELICSNHSIKAICGCENLIMPNPEDADSLLEAKKIFCPTELCGMMGYLTAVEEYLSYADSEDFNVEEMYMAARRLEDVGYRATSFMSQGGFNCHFEEAVKEVYL